ncbi:hypothetical protein [Lacrimispora sp.]|uniref:hypothetical protein n=1 Tax=Lacrimispora sp. TaxID=2719234 RepID=UPI0039932568
MISVKRATAIIFEADTEKRNELVDELSEEDAKFLLKQYMTFFRGKMENSLEFDLK